jgi:hypothetical protein
MTRGRRYHDGQRAVPLAQLPLQDGVLLQRRARAHQPLHARRRQHVARHHGVQVGDHAGAECTEHGPELQVARRDVPYLGALLGRVSLAEQGGADFDEVGGSGAAGGCGVLLPQRRQLAPDLGFRDAQTWKQKGDLCYP